MSTLHYPISNLRVRIEVQRQGRHRIGLLDQHLNLLPSSNRLIEVFPRHLHQLIRDLFEFGDLVDFLGGVVECGLLLEDLGEGVEAVHRGFLDYGLVEGGLEQLADVLEVEEGDALGVLHLAHAHVDYSLQVHHVEHIRLHLESGVFFLRIAVL